MASLIKQIDSRSVHQLQSGQVINDGLNSAVKELVENALDAHATSIEVRFKNYGLDSVEVVDNGDGISSDNYESIALKHYTSKLRTYADLESVTTFGFRGEALSSLCALSDFHIVTATAAEAPKGTRLDFETSGKLKSKTVTAASKGTTVCVANLFKTLPVRRRELERNIRRDYAKVLNLLQAYASICIGVKFSIYHQPSKGSRTSVFATKGNPTTRENISNVFGSKTLIALVPLDLQFEMKSTAKPSLTQPRAPVPDNREVKIVGYISRPVVGEGRNAPDRQMFFVNGRPCVLPQISKAFNEVYKGFNVTQSPFIFADLQLDTHAYDVNVSPDKRTILLHDQADLMENLKIALTELFEKHEQTVPATQLGRSFKLPSFKQTNLLSSPSAGSSSSLRGRRGQWVKDDTDPPSSPAPQPNDDTEDTDAVPQPAKLRGKGMPKYDLTGSLSRFKSGPPLPFKPPSWAGPIPFSSSTTADERARDDSQEPDDEGLAMQEIPSTQIPENPRPPPNRRRKLADDTPATITIGDRSPVTTRLELDETWRKRRRLDEPEGSSASAPKPAGFLGSLGKFMAPGSQLPSSNNVVKDTPGSVKRKLRKAADDAERKSSREIGFSGDDVEDYTEDEVEEHGVEDEESEQEQEEEAENLTSEPNHRSIPAEISGNCCSGGHHHTHAEDDNPLFLPNPELEDEPAEQDLPTPTSPADDDTECLPEPASEGEKRAAARAARMLKEAESYEITQPAHQLLERNFRLFRNPRAVSTLGAVKHESVSLSSIRRRAQRFHKASALLNSGNTGSGGKEDLLNSQDEAAEQRLSLTVTKEDFMKMKIHGQFNKGFILATRGNELFIIDQHASDEKYNFETLQATTVVQNQPLVVPRNLELMAMDEIAVTDNLDVLRRNGFVVEVDPEMPTGRRCKLVSLPMSRETVFGVEDLEELIHLIHQSRGSATSHLRCSKIRAMFAMRACRKSIMVGKALPIRAMEKVVRHMGELDKPWNCPHGRPTMRHLAELSYIQRWTERDEERGGGGLRWDSESWREVLGLNDEEGEWDEGQEREQEGEEEVEEGEEEEGGEGEEEEGVEAEDGEEEL